MALYSLIFSQVRSENRFLIRMRPPYIPDHVEKISEYYLMVIVALSNTLFPIPRR
jgi:hypothetical protein